MSATYGTGAWWNERIEAAMGRAAPIIEGWVRRYLKGGEAVGYVKPTLDDLMQMDAVEALEMVDRMLTVEATQADGIKLLRQIIDRKRKAQEAISV